MTATIRYRQMLVSPNVGGAARIAMDLHRHAIESRGQVSHLILPGGGEAERIARDSQFAYSPYDLPRLMGSGRLMSSCENMALWYRHGRNAKGLVHVHSPTVYGAARLFFLASGLKRVLHIHLDFTADELRWALKHAPDLVIVCADFMRPAVETALGGTAASRTRISVIRNAVDLDRFAPADRTVAKRQIGANPDEPLIVVIANLAQHKGQETAVHAAIALKAQGHRFEMWLAGEERGGEGGFTRRLQSLIDESGVGDRVKLLGFRSDVPALMRAADFLLLPSTSEGLPLVILEAQASRTLVLAAPTAGVPEIVEDGHTGFLIGADDSQGYAERLSLLLRDSLRADSIRSDALAVVRANHRLGNYTERILCEYDQVLSA